MVIDGTGEGRVALKYPPEPGYNGALRAEMLIDKVGCGSLPGGGLQCD
jgi:hypothetical protein